MPPHSAKDLGTVNNLIKVLRRFEKSQELYIVGDFNFSEYKFDNFVTSAYSEPLKRFILFLEENNLSQLVTLPTHTSGHTLDFIISSKPENITNIDILHPFTDTCDHNIIKTTLSIKTSHKSYIDPKPNFYKADYDQINHYLSLTDWDSVLNTRNTNINEIYNSFLEVVHESIKLYVPIMKTNPSSKLPKNIRQILSKKRNLYKRSKSDSSFKTAYRIQDKLYKKSIKNTEDNASKRFYKPTAKKFYTTILKRNFEQDILYHH